MKIGFHKKVSFIKSAFRIFGGILGLAWTLSYGDVLRGCNCFFLFWTFAEILGILEELYEKN